MWVLLMLIILSSVYLFDLFLMIELMNLYFYFVLLENGKSQFNKSYLFRFFLIQVVSSLLLYLFILFFLFFDLKMSNLLMIFFFFYLFLKLGLSPFYMVYLPIVKMFDSLSFVLFNTVMKLPYLLLYLKFMNNFNFSYYFWVILVVLMLIPLTDLFSSSKMSELNWSIVVYMLGVYNNLFLLMSIFLGEQMFIVFYLIYFVLFMFYFFIESNSYLDSVNKESFFMLVNSKKNHYYMLYLIFNLMGFPLTPMFFLKIMILYKFISVGYIFIVIILGVVMTLWFMKFSQLIQVIVNSMNSEDNKVVESLFQLWVFYLLSLLFFYVVV